MVPEYHTIKNIYADATVARAKNHSACSSAASGHIYPLESSSDIQRGQNEDQFLLFSPKYESPHDLPISAHGLVLESVHSTSCSHSQLYWKWVSSQLPAGYKMTQRRALKLMLILHSLIRFKFSSTQMCKYSVKRNGRMLSERLISLWVWEPHNFLFIVL